ncbi:GAF domain-containing protein [Ramlibacter algicola]|uniref:GAF domain-containing protein n=1 Tax=Ramlibacter algicola TaxID=2795217 RepID=A0A934UQI6_9BURK|nr:GAF domain-containing protein [Ramlibacter algicola]MBK0391688.1 GAF domain-containing protein [Ramlibacter algicola]
MTARPTLRELRACLEGAVPAVLATCDADGVPNVAYLSQVFYVDERHVALSFQFFNKTRRNILANPHATVMLIHPRTGGMYRLHIRYLRTESEGALFERMKAQLAGIASHSGMDGVFKLLGSDVYEVERAEQVPGQPVPLPPRPEGRIAALRTCAEAIARSTTLEDALSAVLATLSDGLAMPHAMVLMHDAAADRLYTVASCGYATSGVGSELKVGQGVIGVAARERTPVRISHLTSAAAYTQAMRGALAPEDEPGTEIPYPGLREPHSQLAVPVLSQGRLLGVLFVEGPHDLQFGYEEEDVLVTIASHLGAAIDLLQVAPDAEPEVPRGTPASTEAGTALQVRHFAANDSLFLGDQYLIKGVAGAILWKLVRDHASTGRTEFSNRELRLDPALRLPEVSDNLEARLLLLQRRLQEHGSDLRIERTGRGRFRLQVARPLKLVEA